MMLTELTVVPVAALPVAALKAHLRLGTGFADDAFQDGVLEAHLRAAIGAVEARIGKALVTRRMRLRVEDWRRADDQPFPVAPVAAVISVTLQDGFGGTVTVDPGRYRLVPDMHRPRLVATGTAFPAVASGGWAEIDFDAGFGAAWAAVPVDLGHAVMLLAADYYEHRHEAGTEERGLPFGVVNLIDRWRTVRVLGGGA